MADAHVEHGTVNATKTTGAEQNSAAQDSPTRALTDSFGGDDQKEAEAKGRQQGSALQRLRDKQAQLKQAKEEMESLKDQLRTLNSVRCPSFFHYHRSRRRLHRVALPCSFSPFRSL